MRRCWDAGAPGTAAANAVQPDWRSHGPGLATSCRQRVQRVPGAATAWSPPGLRPGPHSSDDASSADAAGSRMSANSRRADVHSIAHLHGDSSCCRMA
jgi:hypothetical protein